MNKLRLRKFMAALSLATGASIFAVSGHAQTTAATTTTSGQDETQKLEKFVVTGSLIPFAADAPAVPVTTIDVAAIERSGTQTSVLEILRKTVPQFVGNGNLGATNANISSGSTNGGSQIQLFNAATLVLINGRRAASAPAGASGGYVFVDVNLIPVAAIERIDVVTDGSSAIYGSDAIAGVVNVILKTDYEGAEVGGRYAFTDNNGHYAEREGHVIVGAVSGKTNITVSAQWFKADPIFNYERPYSNPTYGTGTFPGSVSIGSSYYYLNPALNAPATGTHQSPADLIAAGVYSGPRGSTAQFQLFNLSQYVTQLASNERQSATVSFDHKLNEKVTFFGDFIYANTQTFSQLNAQPITATSLASDPNNPFNQTVTVRNRFFDHPRTYANDTTSIRGVAGFKGQITPDWSWEVGADYNRVSQDFVNGGLVDSASRAAAVSSGLINLFSRSQAPGAVEDSGMFGTALGVTVSKLITYDAKVAGKIFTLPAGDLQLAVGAEHRIETLEQNSDRNSQAATFGWDSGTTLDPFKSDRKVESLYAEVRIPIVKDVPGLHYVEASAAVRHEVYSGNVGKPTVPKYSLRYLPFNDELSLTATYGKSFAAPSLFSLYGPGGIGFTDPLDLESVSGGTIDGQALVTSGSNVNLKPTRAENYSFGVNYSPKAVKGLVLKASYSHINQKDLISSVGAETILQDVELNGAASPYAQFVHIGGFNGTPITAPGQVSGNVIDNVYVLNTLVNIANQKYGAYNFSADYTFTMDTIGKFNFGAKALMWDKYSIQFLPDTDAYETAGKVTTTNGTLPRWQGALTGDWTRGNWDVYSAVQFWPAVTDDNDGRRIPNIAQVDLAASYTFGPQTPWISGLKVTVGANNLFNKLAPLDPATFTDSNADTATYGSIGRLFFVSANYKF